MVGCLHAPTGSLVLCAGSGGVTAGSWGSQSRAAPMVLGVATCAGAGTAPCLRW